MEWVILGDAANIVQVSITLKLIYAIVRAARSARMHKRNCRQFGQHLKMIAKLLEQLKPQDVEEYPVYPETREPLEHLEQCLKKALVLVENCRDKSYLYLIAMGWSIVNQFKEYQLEIDRYLRLIPLITLVENHREKLRAIERDRREYTLDEEERKIYSTLLKDARTRDDSVILQKSLSRSYPGYCLEKALQEENEKLRRELQKKQEQMDIDQCDVIEHLLEVTKTVNVPPEEQEKHPLPTHSRASTMDSIDLAGFNAAINASNESFRLPSNIPAPTRSPPLKDPPPKDPRPREPPPRDPPPRDRPKEPPPKDPPKVVHISPPPPQVPVGNDGHNRRNETQKWHNGLYDCCIDPFLCISTFLYPCGTFTNIATVVTDGEVSQEMACHDLAFHALYLGCCMHTCCYRRKLRKRFSIPGGTCDDCWAHICCCCCALVQEWREIQAREEEGLKLYKMMTAPSQQTVENYRPRPNLNHPERYAG
ncbi:unnamed protein product [Calypogeia fissa]